MLLFGYNIVLHARSNVIQLQSLIHNPVSAPNYHNVYVYTWYESGYNDRKPNKFENLIAFAFREQYFIHRANWSI